VNLFDGVLSLSQPVLFPRNRLFWLSCSRCHRLGKCTAFLARNRSTLSL
jgi:hypothetical protein